LSARSSLNFPNPFTQTPINISASGDNIVVAGVAGKQIKVFRIKWLTSAAVSISVKDGASTTLDGPMAFGANEGIVLDWPGYDGQRGTGGWQLGL
jgi:hypothetical protein